MNNYVVAALSFAAGTVAGFTLAQFIVIEKEDKAKEQTRVWADQIKTEPKPEIPEAPQVDPAEEESPKDDDPAELISTGPAHIAQPGVKGVNYSKVQQIVKENGYTDPEDIKAVIDDPDNEETYEERLERERLEMETAMSEYRKKNKDKIMPITEDEWYTDFPEVVFEKQDLYYFTEDDVLTDENGTHLDEEEYIGLKPRQFGWMANDERKIYIRNHPKERDFQVWKQHCESAEWWT